MNDTYSRNLTDHRRELEWYHSVKGYMHNGGMRWIIGRLKDWKENNDD